MTPWILRKGPLTVNRRIASILAAAVAWTLGASAAPAEVIRVDDLRQSLFSVCFVDLNEGWTVGDLGRIFHTTDGGKTWEIQKAGTANPFASIACPDKSHVWIVGQNGSIAFSADQGKTWKPQTSGVTKQLLDVSFFDAQRGVAVGDSGTIIRTEDGGNTWVKVEMPDGAKLPEEMEGVVDPRDIVIYGVSTAGSNQVWAAGEFGAILTSSDGGLSFQHQNSPVLSTLFGLHFADEQHGWATGIESVLLGTSDGGVTWNKIAVDTPKGFNLPLFDVEVKGQVGWAVGNSGFLLHTTDAGVTWKLADIPVRLASSWFRGVSMVADGKGYIVGFRGLVLATEGDKFRPLKKNY